MQLKKDDILSRFLQVTENDPTYLRDIILNFVIAGKDTTATALSWFIYMLCKHPAIQNKIAQEVREATGVKEITDFVEFATNIMPSIETSYIVFILIFHLIFLTISNMLFYFLMDQTS